MNAPIVDWRGQRVWLLGASSGIGAALAGALLARGARVAVSGRDAERLARVAPDAGEVLRLPCDATDGDSLRAVRDELAARWQGVDVAIYVAGDYRPLRAWDLAGQWPAAERMLAVNLHGALRFAACVVPAMLERQGGQIGFVASVAGYRGLPRSLIYGPTKAALINFAEALYLDLAPRGVGVRLISPGFVATGLTAGNEFRMPALLTPEEAAEAIVRGFAGGAFEIDFPKRFTRLMKLLGCLPRALYFPLIRRITGA